MKYPKNPLPKKQRIFHTCLARRAAGVNFVTRLVCYPGLKLTR